MKQETRTEISHGHLLESSRFEDWEWEADGKMILKYILGI